MPEPDRCVAIRIAPAFDAPALLIDGAVVARGGDPPRAARRLVLRSREGDEEQLLDVESSPLLEGLSRADVLPFRAVLRLGEDGVRLSAGTWDADLEQEGGAAQRLASHSAERSATTYVSAPVAGHGEHVQPYVTVWGNISLIVREARAHAEVEEVWARDEQISVTGRLLRVADQGPGKLLLRNRDGSEEVEVPAEAGDGRFAASVQIAELTGAALPERHAWDMYLRIGAEELRLRAHLDDVRQKKKVMPFPPQVAAEGESERRLTPYYTSGNDLSVLSVRMESRGATGA